jgi:hypothetical protein
MNKGGAMGKDRPKSRPKHSRSRQNYHSVDRPRHYNSHPSGVECITVVEWMSFNLGNAVAYIWRSGLKGKQREDLKKAIWYVRRELRRLVHGPKNS